MIPFDGSDAITLATHCGLAAVHLIERVGSTMDEAHRLASTGASAGTLVWAEEQDHGRGRQGRAWQSRAGECLTMTLIERPVRADGLDVLSLRLGLSAAEVLDRWAASRIRLKWPNDLKVGDDKLAGILVEARWRGSQLDWVAIGFGVNVSGAPWPDAATLAPGASRVEILTALVPALRRAASATGGLTADELMAYRSRDWARGRRVVEPAVGVVAGISSRGALVIDTAAGPVERLTGSLIPAEKTTDVVGL